MALVSPWYAHQRMILRRRGAHLRWPKILAAAVVAGWALSLIALEFMSSAAGSDVVYTLRSHNAVIALLYRILPTALMPGMILYHLLLMVSTAGAAGSTFLRRGSVPADLLTMTPNGTRRLVLAQFFAVCRTFFPHFALVAAVYTALAIHSGYAYEHIAYFYRSPATNRLVIEMRELREFPPVTAFVAAMLQTAVTSSGMLLLTSSSGVAAAAIAWRYRRAAAVFVRILVLAAVLLPAHVMRWSGALANLFYQAAAALGDGGLQIPTGTFHRFRYMIDPPFPVPDYSTAAALVQLGLSAALSAALLGLSVWWLRRPGEG